LLILFTMWVLSSSGQELNSPQLSQYLADNPFVLAPTYAGIGDHVKIRLNGLSQWVGIKDAPQTQSLAADARIGNRSGAGIFLYNDSNGYTRQQGARVSFAHHLTLDKYEDEFLSFGISYNFNQFRIDIEEFQNIGGDPSVTDDRSTSNHNFDVGVMYRKNKFYVSLNASNLLNKDLTSFNPIFEPNQLRNYYVYTGFRYSKASSKASIVRSSISCGEQGASTTACVFPCPSPRQTSLISACSGAMLPSPGPPRITLTNTAGTSAPIMYEIPSSMRLKPGELVNVMLGSPAPPQPYM